MAVLVTPLYPLNDMLEDMQEACSFTSNKESKISLRKMIELKHSPLRMIQFKIQMYNVPYYVSVHFCRHAAVGQKHFVKSSRTERDEVILSQAAPVDHMMVLNAEHIITMGKARLCNQADDITQYTMMQIQTGIGEHSISLASAMYPDCSHCYNYRKTCKGFQPITIN